MAWWNSKPQIEVIEVTDKPLPLVEDEEAIRALEHHPGFVALMNRLKLQKAVLETQLKTVRHKDIREVYSLQNGIQWLGFLQSEVHKAIGRKKEILKVKPQPTEEEQFRTILAQIEGVGPQA